MNEMWFDKYNDILDNMRKLGENIKNTVDRFDLATTELICGAEFKDYYDGQQIAIVPLTGDYETCISVVEGHCLNECMFDNCQIYDDIRDLWLTLVYAIEFEGDDTLDGVSIDITIDLGLTRYKTLNSIQFKLSGYDQFLKRFNHSDRDIFLKNVTFDEIIILFNETLIKEDATRFEKWLTAIRDAVNEFAPSIHTEAD